MDNIRRTALIAQLQARLDASVTNQIHVVEDDSNAVRDLTPDKARSLLAMFSDQIRKYSTSLTGRIQPTPRLVTAQRPFYDRYSYKPHNGAQEMARRRRQMSKSFRGRPDLLYTKRELSGEPGILPVLVRMHLNSHGIPCRFYS